MSYTYTYAILKVSKAAFTEIMQKLAKAGYSDQFSTDEDGDLIDMHGLALSAEEEPTQNLQEYQP